MWHAGGSVDVLLSILYVKKIINLLETQGWDEGGNGDLR